VATKRVQISIPAELLAKIDSIAHEEKINRSQFIQNVVQLYIMEKRSSEPAG
jgi:metal-responsive CopG/Arc/MetJ family transcriptional regulator